MELTHEPRGFRERQKSMMLRNASAKTVAVGRMHVFDVDRFES